jgi:hypothetical protein
VYNLKPVLLLNLKTLHSQSQLEWHELQVVVQPLQRTLAG